MKPVLATLLFLGSFVRLVLWAGARSAGLDACTLLEARRSAGQYTSLTGEWEAREGGVLRMGELRWALEGKEGAVGLEASLDPEWVGWGPDPRRRVLLTGPWRCTRPPKNPSTGVFSAGPHLSAYGKKFRWASTGEKARPLWRVREAFRRWVGERLARFPAVRALSLATWTGDAGGLGSALRDLYREGGLLHVLALSGQHVAILAGLIGVAAGACLPIVDKLGGTRAWCAAARWKFLAAASVLALVADPLAPLCRSVAMVAAAETLARRSLHVRALGVAASASAAVLLWDPALVASASFWLSVVATLWLSEMTREALPPVRSYLRLSWRMPVVSFPLGAFLFSKVAWLAPITNALVGVVWSVAVLPLGFFAPILPSAALRVLETAWLRVASLQESWGAGPLGYETVVRPTLAEAIAWETLLVIALLPRRSAAPVPRSAIP